VLPAWLKKLLKVEGVLMVTDKASGKVAVEVAEHMTAEESEHCAALSGLDSTQ
jgi:hypothetical protein